jgi:hypothetical protein
VDNLRNGWAGEALALMELFPDTAMVGGRLHRHGRIVEGGYVFGHGGMFGAPERGQDLASPGEGAISFKPRSVGAVSASGGAEEERESERSNEVEHGAGRYRLAPIEELYSWVLEVGRPEPPSFSSMIRRER